MNKIIDTAEEGALKNAANQPHGFVYVDKVLRVKTDGYVVQVTVGWKTPNDSYNPVATVSMPAPFAKELADELLRVYEQAADSRKKPAK
jgi:hypothetical protein